MANLPTSIKNLNTLLGEQLTEGGGGGSSDFSTARVTIMNNTESSVQFFGADMANYGSVFLGEGANSGMVVGSVTALAGDTGTQKVLLIKDVVEDIGVVNQAFFNVETEGVVSVSGACIYSDGGLLITGDCTITISDGQ